MTTLNFSLHDKQQEIFNSTARFKVVPAGRRAGKSYYAAVSLIVEGLKQTSRNGRDLKLSPVWYVAPTYGQAKDIMWRLLKELAAPVTKKALEKDLKLILINDREIVLKGADNEDTLRGSGLGYLVMDEYADMKANTFDLVLLPALADYQGDALFIGTPKGKNHFYDMYLMGRDAKLADTESFRFVTADNPIIDQHEIDLAQGRMSDAAFRQEFMAEFTSGGAGTFKEEMFHYTDKAFMEPRGRMVMTVDPAGFADEVKATISKSAMDKLDEHAIVVAEVGQDGWLIHDVIHGRWGVRETSLRILRAAQTYKVSQVGIEKGALSNAMMPYLRDQMRRLNTYPAIVPLSHGGQNKHDRINWALQGRFEHGRITFLKGTWNRALTEQLLDYPNPLAHDDLVDALAYVDQISPVVYGDEADVVQDDWEPLDDDIGY